MCVCLSVFIAPHETVLDICEKKRASEREREEQNIHNWNKNMGVMMEKKGTPGS